jgi:hypothetical protein
MDVISLPERSPGRFDFLQRFKKPFPPVLVPLILAFGAYVTSLANDFVYDDIHVIVNNELFHSLDNLVGIITGTWWDGVLYRPLTQLTLAVDWVISNGDPAFFHFVNVVLHVACTLLVFRLGRRLLSLPAALVAASLFAIHPVHVEAVANVVGRAEVLATLFALGAAVLYLIDGDLADRGIVGIKRWASSCGVLVLALLAYGSKESALALPGILLILDWITAKQQERRLDETIRRHWVVLTATLVLGLEWMGLRSLILGDLAGVHPGPGVFGEGFFGRVVAMSPVFFEWVRLLVFPLHLSADYSPDYFPPGWGWKASVGVMALVALITVGVRSARKQPMVTFGLAWIGGTLLIVSNLIVPSGVLLAERSLYLPSVGFCFLVAFWATNISVKREIVIGVVAVVVGLGLARTLERVAVWKNPTTFFPRLIVDAEGSFRSYWVAGAIAYQRGDRETGETLMRGAIDIYPVFPNLWNSLAIELEREERWGEAADFYLAAYRIDATRMYDAVSAISSYIRAGQLDSAESVARFAISRGGDDYRLFVLLADVAMARDEPLRAMTYRRLVAFRLAHVWQYWYLTAEAAVLAGYCPEAQRSLERVRELKPDFEDNLGVVSGYESMACNGV